MLKVTTEKMKSLVQGILDYSRTDATQVEKVEIDLNELFKEIIETDQLSFRADIKIVGTLPSVMFNRSALEQILRNLLSNAVKHANKDLCQVVIRVRDNKEQHVICVSDDGPGIAPEDQERIFELFQKVSSISRADSHGIGLATVKSLLDAFGERIWVESILGKGSTFCFTIRK
jgi:signal transduction histidine kinase